MSNNNFRTDFLFPTNNWFIGLGSLLNISGNYFLYNYSPSDQEADNKAILRDWNIIWRDFEIALENNHDISDNAKTSNKKQNSKQLELFD